MSENSHPKILHVDDREENRYIVSKILRNAGFEVIEGRTGRQALELAVAQPDLIILDVRLPDMIGYEVSKRIKSNPATSSIPIIQLSASFVTNESKVQALDSGADQYLTQPVEAPVLVASVKALLRMREAEAISRLSARQWQTTFDALSEGIGLLDNARNILRCNRAMSELLHLSYAEIEGRNCKDILETVFGAEECSKLRSFATRQTFECQAQRSWYRVTIDPVVNDNGEPVGSILVIGDTSSQKQAEEALKITEKLAATGRLAHSIAHEINNPLESVTNLIYLLKLLLKDHSEAKAFLDVADVELERVSRITKQTLSFHRDSALPTRVSVTDLIESVLVLYGPQVAEKKVAVKKRFDTTGELVAFPGQLRQVFSNLISNALDASSPSGSLMIHVFESRSWKDDAKGIRVVFCDTGKGIPQKERGRIFEAFFTTKEQKGSGLGLWLSAGIISQHRGRIRVRSRTSPPSGTCFSLFFPVPEAAASDLEETIPIQMASSDRNLEKESA